LSIASTEPVRLSCPESTPCAMSPDWPPIATITPQE
jgi:hypothetical protein